MAYGQVGPDGIPELLRRPAGSGQSSTTAQQILRDAIANAQAQVSAQGQSGIATVRRAPGVGEDGVPDYLRRPVPGQPSGPANTPLGAYVQEFSDRWETDPNFQTWVMSRSIAAGLVNPKTATVGDYMNAWENVGKAASVEKGAWKGTPEQLFEFWASGQNLTALEVEQAIRDGLPIIDPATGLPVGPDMGDGAAAPVNPITTYRTTSSATINREAAYAAADQLSQQLLGRMASKKEMAKARAVMNRLLAANPTVTNRTVDSTDPNNVVSTERTTDGMSAADAQNAVQMKIQRSSEGTAYGVGNMFEDAMRMMASREA